jgi:Family of unknown function (DUF5522)/Cysteine-rich CWC
METQESPEELSPIPARSPGLGRDEQCPLCGGDNRCRVAKGHLYKGPCWCHEIIVPNHILSRLAVGRLEPACLCRPCLETVARISREEEDTEIILAGIREALSHHRPAPDERDFYLDDNGNVVFTSAYHLKRGTCCENGCRHCPYQRINASGGEDL